MLRQEGECRAGLKWFMEETRRRLYREVFDYAANKVVVVERSMESLGVISGALRDLGKLTLEGDLLVRNLTVGCTIKTLNAKWHYTALHLDVCPDKNLARVCNKAVARTKNDDISNVLFKYHTHLVNTLGFEMGINADNDTDSIAKEIVAAVESVIEAQRRHAEAHSQAV